MALRRGGESRRRYENPQAARPCGFKSHRPHHFFLPVSGTERMRDTMFPPRRLGMEPSLDKTSFLGRAAKSIGAAPDYHHNIPSKVHSSLKCAFRGCIIERTAAAKKEQRCTKLSATRSLPSSWIFAVVLSAGSTRRTAYEGG